jgi:hypothetical protein
MILLDRRIMRLHRCFVPADQSFQLKMGDCRVQKRLQQQRCSDFVEMPDVPASGRLVGGPLRVDRHHLPPRVLTARLLQDSDLAGMVEVMLNHTM